MKEIAVKVSDFCNQLETRLAAIPTPENRMEAAMTFVAQAFRVNPDEVAVLSLDPERELLGFLWPVKLQHSGVLPLSSANALAARTVRENKAFLDNRFASAHHAFIFEKVRLDTANTTGPLPIQKIISAPLPGNGYIKGVIQVSRKGEDPVRAGEDFTKNDIAILVEISRVIARQL
jgi:GAF domain-containing protein